MDMFEDTYKGMLASAQVDVPKLNAAFAEVVAAGGGAYVPVGVDEFVGMAAC
jgi:hypothetical protein